MCLIHAKKIGFQLDSGGFMRFVVLCALVFLAACGGTTQTVRTTHSSDGSKNIWKVYHDPAKFRQANARANLQGKISVVMIGSTTCGPCKSVQSWWNHHPVEGVRFVEFEIDDRVEDAQEKAVTTVSKYLTEEQRKQEDVVLPLCSIERNGKLLYQDDGKRGRTGCLEVMQMALEKIRSEPKSRIVMKPVEWKTVTTSAEFWKEVQTSKRAIVLFSSPTCGPCHHAIDWWKTQRASTDITFIEYKLESDDNTSSPERVKAWLEFSAAANHFIDGKDGAPVPVCGLVHPLGDGGHVHDVNYQGDPGCREELAKEIGIKK